MTAEMSNTADVARHAVQAAEAGKFVERLAERIGGQASVRAVFGEPIQRGDPTIVARVRWALGGGAGSAARASDEGESGSGSRGGGGAAADPVGFLEIGPVGASFRRIAQPNLLSPMFVLALGLAAAAVLRGIARLRHS